MPSDTLHGFVLVEVQKGKKNTVLVPRETQINKHWNNQFFYDYKKNKQIFVTSSVSKV